MKLVWLCFRDEIFCWICVSSYQHTSWLMRSMNSRCFVPACISRIQRTPCFCLVWLHLRLSGSELVLKKHERDWRPRTDRPLSLSNVLQIPDCACLRFSSNVESNVVPDSSAFSSQNFLKKKYCSNFQPKIRRAKHDLIVNLITLMDGKSRDESIKSN